MIRDKSTLVNANPVHGSAPRYYESGYQLLRRVLYSPSATWAIGTKLKIHL